MKEHNHIKEFQKYLSRGLEIIKEDDNNLNDLLSEIRDQLNVLEEKIPESEILSSVFLTLLKDKKACEKQLNELRNSYDEVLGLITHEFKNILTSIHGYNMLLENRLEHDKDKESLYHLKDSDRLTRQLFDMTDSLLKMSLGEKGLINPELKLVDFVQDLLEPIQRDLATQLRNKQMKIVLKRQTKNLILECDEGLLDIVIRNLLINAIKYGKQKSEIDVNINRTKSNFSIAIRNFSNAIPGDLCIGIFEKFRSRKIGSEKGGTGIGLYNVRNIVRLHRGHITCECAAKKWIEFRLSIPQNI